MAKSQPQYACVEQNFGQQPAIIHCPICGQATMESPDDGFNPCKHVAFVYVGVCGDFEYKSPEFEAKTASEEGAEQDFSFDNFRNALANLGYDNKLLALEVTYGGMACGPVWYTDVYGFDFAQIDENDDK